MNSVQSVTLSRDCNAVQIPAGNTVTLPAGTEVDITQTLGGSYTVHALGGLFRLGPRDADALGLKPEEIAAVQAGACGLVKPRIRGSEQTGEGADFRR